jgi:hypothetical protein
MKPIFWRVEVPNECPCCAYPRQGLKPDASCPECGFPFWPKAPCFRFNTRKLVWFLAAYFAFVALTLALAGISLGFTGSSLFVLAALAVSCAIILPMAFRRPEPTWTISREGLVMLRGGHLKKMIPWARVARLELHWFFPSYVRVYPPADFGQSRAQLFHLCTGRMAREFVAMVNRMQPSASGMIPPSNSRRGIAPG